MTFVLNDKITHLQPMNVINPSSAFLALVLPLCLCLQNSSVGDQVTSSEIKTPSRHVTWRSFPDKKSFRYTLKTTKLGENVL